MGNYSPCHSLITSSLGLCSVVHARGSAVSLAVLQQREIGRLGCSALGFEWRTVNILIFFNYSIHFFISNKKIKGKKLLNEQ
jgi:hypothetical protein